MFANHIFNKGPPSKLHKQHLQLSKNDPTENGPRIQIDISQERYTNIQCKYKKMFNAINN